MKYSVRTAVMALIVTVLMVVSTLALPEVFAGADVSAGKGTQLAEEQPKTVETEVERLSSRGNSAYLKLTQEELEQEGYSSCDMIKVTVGSAVYRLPYVSGRYSFGFHEEGISVSRSAREEDADTVKSTLSLHLNSGHLTDVAAGTPVTLSMDTKGGYQEIFDARQIGSMTNSREDYPGETDAQYANFREVTTTGMGKGKLYRTSNPVNPRIGRNTYSDALIREAGVTTVINMSDTPEKVTQYEGYEQSYYSTIDTIELGMNTDFGSGKFNEKLMEAYRFMIDHPGVYEINCIFGKDRTGFAIAVLECLMGASYEEICADYVETYRNYYHDYFKYDPIEKRDRAIAEAYIVPQLEYAFGVEDLKACDLKEAARSYLIACGLTEDEVASLQHCLTAQADEIKENTMKASGRTVKVSYKKISRRSQAIKRASAIKVSDAKGKVTYKKISVSKKKFTKRFTVNTKTGRITVKKGTPKGTYKLKVRVRAAGIKNQYKAKSKDVTVKIRVK